MKRFVPGSGIGLATCVRNACAGPNGWTGAPELKSCQTAWLSPRSLQDWSCCCIPSTADVIGARFANDDSTEEPCTGAERPHKARHRKSKPAGRNRAGKRPVSDAVAGWWSKIRIHLKSGVADLKVGTFSTVSQGVLPVLFFRPISQNVLPKAAGAHPKFKWGRYRGRYRIVYSSWREPR